MNTINLIGTSISWYVFYNHKAYLVIEFKEYKNKKVKKISYIVKSIDDKETIKDEILIKTLIRKIKKYQN